MSDSHWLVPLARPSGSVQFKVQFDSSRSHKS
jgi:hypothetical protein